MGLFDFLGAVGGAVAAPFTGGASLAPILGRVIGNVAGGAAKARQEGRAAEAGLILGQDRNRILAARALEEALLGRGQLDLAQREFQESAPSGRLSQAGRADIIQALPGALAARGPRQQAVGGRTITSFGLDPAAFAPSQETQDLAGLVRQRALTAQQAGDTFAAPPPLPDLTPTALPSSSGVDTFLNIAAGGGALLGGVGEVLDERRRRREQERQETIAGPLGPRG